MKKHILMILLITGMGICFAYSKPDKAKESLETVTGYIRTYGNEPFTFIGLVTQDGKEYTIKADEKSLKQLNNIFKEKIQIKGKITKSDVAGFNELKDGNLIVIEWKKIK